MFCFVRCPRYIIAAYYRYLNALFPKLQNKIAKFVGLAAFRANVTRSQMWFLLLFATMCLYFCVALYSMIYIHNMFKMFIWLNKNIQLYVQSTTCWLYSLSLLTAHFTYTNIFFTPSIMQWRQFLCDCFGCVSSLSFGIFLFSCSIVPWCVASTKSISTMILSSECFCDVFF